jgi:integration host factor subunit beta
MEKSKLTKAEIVEKLHNSLDLNRQEVHQVLDAFFDEIKLALKEKQVIELRGFGTFEVRVRKGKEKARNPKTGEVVSVDEHGVAVFRPGRELKEMVW